MKRSSDKGSRRGDQTGEKVQAGRICVYFFVGFYILLMAEFTALFAKGMDISSFRTFLFTLCTAFLYPFLYMLPLAGIVGLLYLILRISRAGNKIQRMVLFSALTLGSGVTMLLLFVDYKIYSMFCFHINSFVLNLIFTPGGIESMGASNTDKVVFALLTAVCILAGYGILAMTRVFVRRINPGLRREIFSGSVLLCALVAAGIFSAVEYAYCGYRNTPAVYHDSQKVPFYIPVRMNSIFHKLNIKEVKHSGVKLRSGKTMLRYPLRKLNVSIPEKQFNIVWLVAESWRADTLTPEIMPSTAKFAEKCIRFHNHYSSGNGTRMALFGMFYGLYGSYWKAALAEQTPPVIMQVLKQQNYQFDMYTSAKFTYPEFDRTIFSNISGEHLHQSDGRGGFVNDRLNIGRMLSFIRNRDRTRPFMTFMFYESPHAPYTFPEECVIRRNYLRTFNYSTVDISANIAKIKDRYINAVHHLDSQQARVFDFLEQEKLLDSTIVIVTGDHGEEFLEKGHWGHNKGFHQEEITPPLLLYVPGEAARDVSGMTSHLDLPATIGALIGISSPAEDYSLGFNLLKTPGRQYTVCASWDELCYIDGVFKDVIEPMGYNILTSTDDAPVSGTLKKQLNMPLVFDMMKNANIFYAR